MPKSIIDLLETIEIDKVHGETATTNLKNGKCILEFFDQLNSIGQASQNIMMREKADTPIGLLLFLRPTGPGNCGD